MHSIDRAWLTVRRKQLFTSDRTCNNIANQRVTFRQVSCEVHLLPLVTLLYAESWEAEVRTYSVSSDEINLSMVWLNVDIIRMLFFP